MTKTIFQIQPTPQSLSRPLAMAAILVVLALSIGGALAQRMERRAAEDRLSFGDTEQTCVGPACSAAISVNVN